MKKIVSLLIIFTLMLGILCCFMSCARETTSHITQTDDQTQENNDTVTEIPDTDNSAEEESAQNDDNPDADYSDHVSTESTPTCCVTKVWFEDFYGECAIKFDYSESDKSNVQYMKVELFNSKSEEWEYCTGCYPSDDYILSDFFSTKQNFGTYSKIRCTCVAAPNSGFSDAVFEQDLNLSISINDDPSHPASVSYVKNEGKYEVTVTGVAGGVSSLVHTYSGPGYEYPDCQQIIPSMSGKGPRYSYKDWPPLLSIDTIEGYYRVLQYDIATENSTTVSAAYTDVSGWQKIMP